VTWRPCRAEGVEVNVVGDGYVVYDGMRDRVHYLNQTSALVFELATGEQSVEQIAGVLQRAYDLTDAPDDDIRGCLERLRNEGLVT
jgi:hypothetical protein